MWPRQSASRVTRPSTPGSPTFATRVAVGRRSPDPRLEGTANGRRIGKDVGVVPFGARDHDDIRLVRVEVACVLVGFDDERRSPPPTGGRRRTTGEARRQQRSDERRRVAAGLDQDMHEPARGRALAVRPGHADHGSTEGRIGDDLLPRFQRDPQASGRRPAPVGPDRRPSAPSSRPAGRAEACPSRGSGHARRRWGWPGPSSAGRIRRGRCRDRRP